MGNTAWGSLFTKQAGIVLLSRSFFESRIVSVALPVGERGNCLHQDATVPAFE
jgi:hypothetical protein